MRVLPIKLTTPNEIKSFVYTMNCYPYDADLRSGRHVVDAKSILGIFSLDLSKPLKLIIHHDCCDNMIAEIQPFVV